MSKANNHQIDLGLAVIAAVRQPGEELSQTEIAEICGVSKLTIWRIEQKALEKLRRAAKKLKP